MGDNNEIYDDGLYLKCSPSTTVKDRPEISSPVDFEHTVHVGFNQNTGEFTVSLVSSFLSVY